MELITAAQDLEGLARALPLFFEFAARSAEPAFVKRRRAWREQAAANPARFRDIPFPDIPLAHEMWIAHLAWLDAVDTSAGWQPGDLTADEIDGLALYRRERERFRAGHKTCPACGSMNNAVQNWCGGCGKNFGAPASGN